MIDNRVMHDAEDYELKVEAKKYPATLADIQHLSTTISLEIRGLENKINHVFTHLTGEDFPHIEEPPKEVESSALLKVIQQQKATMERLRYVQNRVGEIAEMLSVDKTPK